MIKDRFQQVQTKKVIVLSKDELSGKTMTEFVVLRAKSYTDLMEDGSKLKKSNGTKTCVMEQETMFKNYKDSLLNNEIILKI